MLDRLLQYTQLAIDKAPHPVIALKARHSSGFKWSIQSRVLTAETETGGALGTVALDSLTLLGLAGWLESHGCQVTDLNVELSSRSAATLLSGAGSQSQSNGDALYAFDSLLWSILDAYAVELEGAESSIAEAIQQMDINTASGVWLDFWGEFLGLLREGLSDSDYREYLITETLRARCNPLAIEQAILARTGWNVQITEPWKDLFTLDQSSLSGQDRTYDGVRYGYHLIRPITRDAVDWDRVMAVINRNRPGGVLVVGRLVQHAAVLDASLAFLVDGKNTRLAVSWSPYEDKAILDYMAIEDVSIQNYESRRRRTNLWRADVVSEPVEYLVLGKHSRIVNAYYFSVAYEQQYWDGVTRWDIPGLGWDANAVVLSSHTRS